MKWYGLLLTACCLLLLPHFAMAVQQSDQSDKSDPITIAAIFSMTGIAARNNQPVVDMVELTVDRINKEGGVLGRKIDLLVLDNKSTPIGALEAARKAVAARVTAVIGAHWSSHSLAIAPVLQEAGIPMISPASTNPDVTVGRDSIFRVCFIDSVQGRAMARFAVDQLQMKTVAILRNVDERYSDDLGGYFRAGFLGLGGKVVLDVGYRGDSADFSDIIEKLLSLQPAGVYIPGYTRDTALFMRQARKMGFKGLFLGGDGWDMLGTLVSDAVEGSYQSVPWHPDVPYPESRTMQDFYLEMSEDTIRNLSAPLAYDAVMLLAEAIRRAGSGEPARVRAALAATRDFPGATGPITFDGNGDPRDKEVIIVKFVRGETVFVTSVKP